MENKIKVGDTVWVKGYRGLSEQIVDKVGREYFYIGRSKFAIKTLREVSSYGVVDKVYLSLAEYESEQRSNFLHKEIQSRFVYGKSVSLPDMEAIAKIIGINT